MSMEMAVVTFDGTHGAEHELSALRASRDDACLNDVAVLEHHLGGSGGQLVANGRIPTACSRSTSPSGSRSSPTG